MCQIFIQTRGKLLDYRFILNEPKDSWWEKYKKLTTFEYPTILIENINHNPRIYLSGIHSKRKDSQPTIIRYTLVIELDKNNADKDAVLKLVSKWLYEVQKSANNCKEQSDIGILLDAQFPEKTVEKLLDKTTKESENIEKKKTLDTGFKEFLKNIYNEDQLIKPSAQCNKYQMWWGGVQNPDSREAWISLVDKLLKDKVQGGALLLNLADKSDMEQLSNLVNESDMEQLSTQLSDRNIGLLIKNNEQKPQKFPTKFRINKKKFLNWILTIPLIQYLYSRFHK